MIFALYDFFKYWSHKGIYSDENLKKEGAILASKEILPLIENIKSATIFVHTRDSFLSWLVMYYTGPAIWSHTVIMIEGGILYDLTIKGGVVHHISDYFDGKSFIGIINLPVTTEGFEKMILSAETMFPNCKFAWGKTFRYWLAIVTGTHPEYRLQYSLDIIITLSLIFILSYPFHTIQIFITVILFIYISVVLFNKLLRKASNKLDMDAEANEDTNKKRRNKEKKLDLFYETVVNSPDERFSTITKQFKEIFSDTPEILVKIFNRNAGLLCKIKKFDRAKICYQEAIGICEKSGLNNSLMHASILSNHAGLLVQTNQINQAKQNMQKAIKIVQTSKENENKKRELLEYFSNNLQILQNNHKAS
jgi:hypothetical protein